MAVMVTARQRCTAGPIGILYHPGPYSGRSTPSLGLVVLPKGEYDIPRSLSAKQSTGD